jgi:hypothetical protein
MELIDYFSTMVVSVYIVMAALVVGWMMPRGRHLKLVQLKALRALHNFFADEEEYIAHKVERIRNATNKRTT